ncbi:MAG TPA: hypothetical protein VII27_01955 [Thermoplasmata archaeon]
MAQGSDAPGRRPFWVQLVATLLLIVGVPGLVSALVVGDGQAVLLFAVLMILGMAAESWAYFLRSRANSAAR